MRNRFGQLRNRDDALRARGFADDAEHPFGDLAGHDHAAGRARSEFKDHGRSFRWGRSACYHYPMNLSSSMFRPIAGRRRAICGLLGTLAFATLVSGCSPEFNWRETRSDEQRFIVLLPARPATMSREIDLEGRRVQMTMTGARVHQAMFTVGAIQLAAPDAGLDDERVRRVEDLRVLDADRRQFAQHLVRIASAQQRPNV